MTAYADTSFLFSLLVPDAHSPQAIRIRAMIEASLSLSRLNRLELGNAVSLAVFQGRLNAEEAAVVRGRVLEDFASGALIDAQVDWSAAFEQADLLSLHNTHAIGCRSLDVLQVAIAITIGANTFLSFDARQRALAELGGLRVLPSSPVTPPRSTA